jgi:hypothetical protein
MYKNISIKSKVTEALSLRKRGYSPASPLRSPGVLDTRKIFVLEDPNGGTGSFSSYAFSSQAAAERFMKSALLEDDDCQIVELYGILATNRGPWA